MNERYFWCINKLKMYQKVEFCLEQYLVQSPIVFVGSRLSRKNQKEPLGTTLQQADVLASRISEHHAQNKLGSHASGRCRSLMMTFWRRARCVTLKQEHSKTIHCLFLPLKSMFTGLWRIRSPTKLSHTPVSYLVPAFQVLLDWSRARNFSWILIYGAWTQRLRAKNKTVTWYTYTSSSM